MKTRYYACVDGERIVPLGECECFDDAEEKSPAGTMWLYDEAGLRALFASIKEGTGMKTKIEELTREIKELTEIKRSTLESTDAGE